MALQPNSPTEKKRSVVSGIRELWQASTAPNPSIKDAKESRKAKLLATLSLIISTLLLFAFFLVPHKFTIFTILLAVAFASYLLSRSIYYQFGIYLFVYVFTAIGFLTIYTGNASTAETAISTTVYFGLVVASVLLSQTGFVVLVSLSIIASITIPFYSNIPVEENVNAMRIAGDLFAMGALLFGINLFRQSLEKEQLAEVNAINQTLKDLATRLEDHIKERTQEIEQVTAQVQKQSLRIQTISDISQEISSSIKQTPNELLTKIAQIISKKLDYYHVGIFLLDKDREFAILRATNSQGGQKMLANHHQLKVGGAGIVGFVSQSGRARIALDTSADTVFFNNPDLPETHSEMALPLKYGNTVIGVLDIQSSESNAFNKEDIETLNTLTNQIALMVKNIQITDEAPKGVTNQKIKISSKDIKRGYTFQPDGSVTVTNLPEHNLQIQKAIASGETVVLSNVPKGSTPTIAVPVKFREQVIGVLHIEATKENRNWTEDEILLIQAVSDRAGLALENARLLDDSQRRATKEQAISEISTKIGATADIESILRTAVRELGAQISGTQISVEIGGSKD